MVLERRLIVLLKTVGLCKVFLVQYAEGKCNRKAASL